MSETNYGLANMPLADKKLLSEEIFAVIKKTNMIWIKLSCQDFYCFHLMFHNNFNKLFLLKSFSKR